MRVSTENGYDGDPRTRVVRGTERGRTVVYLDGVRLDHCHLADDEEGVVRVGKRGEPIRELRGVVRIEVIPEVA